MEAELDLAEIRYRIQNHASFRLLRKEKAPLMLAFFVEAFKKPNRSDLPRGTLAAELGAFREYAALTAGDGPDERSSVSYLDEWADEGFLRKYYRSGQDEPNYDLTPESEKAIEWVRELSERRFVGTESRLVKVFDLMRDLAYGASFDSEERIAELERKKAEIEAEIAQVRSGGGGTLAPTAIRERYYELEDTARRLLADFRQIERNFRELDREARSKVIEADMERGRVLKDIFEFRDAIMSSDQGKSFQTFWAFVMSSLKREEFSALADRVLAVGEIAELSKSIDLTAFDRLLVQAGSRVQATAHLLNEELRSFLDERRRREGREIVLLAEGIKKLALAVRDDPPTERNFLEIEGDADIDLVMDRPLFKPEETARISEHPAEAGAAEADTAALFDQDGVDHAAIAERIRLLLAERDQVPLSAVLDRFPVEGGAAELLAYLAAASVKDAALIRDELRETLRADNKKREKEYVVNSPNIVYLKEGAR